MLPGMEKEGAALLDTAHQHENKHNDEYEAKTAAWIVTPARAVRPGRKQSEKQNYQDNEQEKSHGKL